MRTVVLDTIDNAIRASQRVRVTNECGQSISEQRNHLVVPDRPSGVPEATVTFQHAMSSVHIDLAYLERLYKGDRTRIAQWIGVYLEEAPGTFQQLADSLKKGDGERLVAAAHDLRPYAHYLGAGRMLELLIAIGQGVRSDGPTAAAESVKEVLDLSRAAEDELRSVLARYANDAEPV